MLTTIPPYEVFTFPDANGVDGIVKSTRPLYFNGVKIDNFELKFKDGKVIDFKAEKGAEALEYLLKIDDGSTRLGEVALVNCNSPVARQNVVFCNTLLDENSSCHFALGRAFPACYENGNSMTEEELEKVGLNKSSSHVDFMVGTQDLQIEAITHNGERLIIFKDGKWTF